MRNNHRSVEFLQYLSEIDETTAQKLPSLKDLSVELDMSIPRLREQLEVAKAFGLVDVRPRTGIRRRPYSFYPPVYQSLMYALAQDRGYFECFSELRNHIEASYWEEAVRRLTADDLAELDDLVRRAWSKLLDQPVRIPHQEHRQLHLKLFQRLDNPFVVGLLEAYWDAYEAVGFNLYADYDYLKKVWTYHTELVNAIRREDFAAGYTALTEHKELLRYHGKAVPERDALETSTIQ